MTKIHLDDTIAAIATPIGEGGVSIIRVSGKNTREIVGSVFRPYKTHKLRDYASHTIHLGCLDDSGGQLIDQCLVSTFWSPNSYTGEDLIEIGLHGGLVVTHRALAAVVNAGARHAEPGEFTKRAFLNGKIDLMQAEAVLDLIKAKSEKASKIAAGQLCGELSLKLKSMKDELMRLYAHMEAFIDFPDEQIEIYSDETIGQKIKAVQREIQNLIRSFTWGSLIREGIQIVIAGKPNVGKSSLFNALLEMDRALVSEYAGTTRDQLEEQIEIGGITARLIDTAGLMTETTHPLDRMGVERTREILAKADLCLFVVDGSNALTQEDLRAYQDLCRAAKGPKIILMNKTDLTCNIDRKALSEMAGETVVLGISAKTQKGLNDLEEKIIQMIFQQGISNEGEQITRLRHKQSLESALSATERMQDAFGERQSLEFVTLELKAALDALSEMIGEVYSEDLLDVIFAEFCIGK
ncbi:MAG: tRNA uridine-5-carboxymethylaminomethyl(34) synthesis GTPase MnmE [Candidatus Omnitrophica bacterium]|nr:tRNA uridine-5-carboxymethylaminomethyl(34) synthesis GTPase MnmE [Candidatus Omnitrophota bacterium]